MTITYTPQRADQQDKVVAVVQRFFTVFYASQVDGINEYTPPPVNEIEAHETRAEIIFGGGKTFYQPSTDSIHMPPKGDFITLTGYYSTLLYELTHWTGHSSRLKRNIYGERHTTDYVCEELVVEIGSVFISCAAKIPQSEEAFNNHASYVDE